jgi:hypothetical protein
MNTVRRLSLLLAVSLLAHVVAVPPVEASPEPSDQLRARSGLESRSAVVDSPVASLAQRDDVGIAVDREQKPEDEPRASAEADRPGLTAASRSGVVPAGGGVVALEGVPVTLVVPSRAYAGAVDVTLTVPEREVARDVSPFEAFFSGGDSAVEMTLDYSDVRLTDGGHVQERLVIYRVEGCSDRKVEFDDGMT